MEVKQLFCSFCAQKRTVLLTKRATNLVKRIASCLATTTPLSILFYFVAKGHLIHHVDAHDTFLL
jgi:hypothetical protein